MTQKTPDMGAIYLEHLFCKRAVFEQRQVPSGNPEIRVLGGGVPLRIGARCRTASAELLEVELTLEIPSEAGDASLPYHVEATFIGRFRINNLPEGLSLERFAKGNGIAIMFPYVREMVANLTMRGSFGPIQLPTMNVVAMLEQGNPAPDVQVESPAE